MTSFLKKFKKLDLGLHGVRLPSFEIEKKYKHQIKVDEDLSNEEFLQKLYENGLNKLNLNNKNKEVYLERAKREFGFLSELGFVDYVLPYWSY